MFNRNFKSRRGEVSCVKYSKETDIYRELKRDVEALKEIPKNLTDSVDKIDFGNGIKVTDEFCSFAFLRIKNLVTNRAKIQTIINEMSDEIDSYRAELNKSDWKVNYNEVSKTNRQGIKNLVKSYLKMN
ncbi:hypothetical protein EfmAA96_18950 [Enterococcus faecium]|nr:hypothetical protein EfmAA96_18950 [Enterococcus faecium]